MHKEPTPRVELQSIFVRDHQRRLSLVIELQEEGLRLKQSPPPSPTLQPVKRRRIVTASTTHTGGQFK
jgi:hypothetical protein